MRLCSKDNPRLVYVSLPGYGEGHPKRNAAGWDAAIGAETGFFSPPEGVAAPVFSPLPMPSVFAAVLGALGVAAALLARGRTRVGQRIEAPLHASMFSAIGLRLVRSHGSDLNRGSGFVNIGSLMSRQYRCADGRWAHNHGMYERFVHQFLKAAGREEWTDEIISYVRGPEDPEAQAAWRRRFEKPSSSSAAPGTGSATSTPWAAPARCARRWTSGWSTSTPRPRGW